MRSEILSVGSELLRGDIIDTNAAFLARQLARLGFSLQRVTQVADDMQELQAVLRASMERSRLVICTGGIGPTPDDLTREAVASVLDEPMTVDPDLERDLRRYFEARTMRMPERNLKQASLIPSARALRNRMGTAPGWWVERDQRVVVLLPGVPYEMTTIWAEEVEPKLAGMSGRAVVTKTLKTYGLGESLVAEKLGELLEADNPVVATYAKSDGVHVTVTATSDDREAALALAHSTAKMARQALEDAVWGEDDQSLAALVSRTAERLSMALRVEEQASEGLLSSALYREGAVTLVQSASDSDRPHVTLRIGPPTRREGARPTYACAVSVDSQESTESREVTASSLPSLADRASTAALLLALNALRPAKRESNPTGGRLPGRE